MTNLRFEINLTANDLSFSGLFQVETKKWKINNLYKTTISWFIPFPLRSIKLTLKLNFAQNHLPFSNHSKVFLLDSLALGPDWAIPKH